MSRTGSDRLTVEYVSVQGLRPTASNAKIHSKRQIEKIAKSIKRFGFSNPVLISDMEIIAGHGRVEAAKCLGLKLIPAVRLSGLSEAERLAYSLADNRLAEFGRYDQKQLTIQLEQLALVGFDDIEVTGFSLGDIRLDQFAAQHGNSVGPDDDLPMPSKRVVSRTGDLWKLGRHCLLCGDATRATDVRRLMGGEQAEGLFLDPFWNLAAGPTSELEDFEILSSSLRLAKAASKPGAIIFVFSSGHRFCELFTVARAEQLPLETLVVLAKREAGMGGLYRSQHEVIVVLTNGDAADLSSSALARRGRHRSNLWKYADGISFEASPAETLSVQRTCRPVALIADAIKDVSRRGAIVLDAFAGGGSTLIAAEKTGRRAYLLEPDPACCDLILRRYHSYTGQAAELPSEGLTFGDAEESRLAEHKS